MIRKYLFFNILVLYLSASFVCYPVYAQQGFGQAIGNRRIQSVELERLKERDVKSFGSFRDGTSDLSSLIQSGMPTSLSGGTSGASVFYNIHVLGEVSQPGTYRILPSDRVSDVLKYAGGISLNGSERAVQLRRQGKAKVLDLFSYKHKGWLNQNPYLMENDVVFIPVKKGEIQIEGPVNRPGHYEITKPITLKQAIEMAEGGSVGLSKKEPIRVVRFNSEEKKEIIEIENSDNNIDHFRIQKGDVIVVPHVLIADKEFDYNLTRIPGDNIFYPTVDDNVYVIGAIALPGAYEFKPHYTYKEYVSLAGPTREAKMKSIKLIRPDGKKLRVKKNTNINPGDTIVVPARYWRAETVASWLSTLSSLTLSGLVIHDRLRE